MKKIVFLNLGKHPIANNYLKLKKNKKEFFYNLKLIYHSDTKLISLAKFVAPKKMFNDKYAYRASMSKTMRNANKKLAKLLLKNYKPKSILEIGSNDGCFIKHFKKIENVGVEPCKNLSDITNKMNIKTYPNFWKKKLAKKIIKEKGKFDIIYSANTISHIHNLKETFEAVEIALKDDGIFILEEPSLFETLKKVSYDQFYDEHAYVFSLIALRNITKENDIEIFKVIKLKTHGGSNRIFFKKKKNKKIKISKNVLQYIYQEKKYGIHKLQTYKIFAKRVKNSKKVLVKIFKKIKKEKKIIIGYGATAKSSTVLNYCGLRNNFIEYFLDTTPTKFGKFTPGSNIPIIKYNGIPKNIEYAYLGAWNFKDEIFKKEKKFIKNGGKFITHVPYPTII
jgi:SAM-dependent methyltransferase